MADSKPKEQSGTIKAAWIGINIAWVLGWVGAAGVIIMVVSMHVFDFRATYITMPLEVEFDEGSAETFNNTINSEGVLIKGFENLTVFGKEVHIQKHLMWLPLALILFYLGAVHNIRKCLRNIKKGKPFDFNNARYFRNVGILVLVGGPFYGLSMYIYGLLGKGYVDIPGAYVSPILNIHIEIILAGLIILAFGQIYKEAIQIKAEHDFTI